MEQWRRRVSRLIWDQETAGSDPACSTKTHLLFKSWKEVWNGHRYKYSKTGIRLTAGNRTGPSGRLGFSRTTRMCSTVRKARRICGQPRSDLRHLRGQAWMYGTRPQRIATQAVTAGRDRPVPPAALPQSSGYPEEQKEGGGRVNVILFCSLGFCSTARPLTLWPPGSAPVRASPKIHHANRIPWYTAGFQ